MHLLSLTALTLALLTNPQYYIMYSGLNTAFTGEESRLRSRLRRSYTGIPIFVHEREDVWGSGSYFLGSGFHFPLFNCAYFWRKNLSCMPGLSAASKTAAASFRLRFLTARSARTMMRFHARVPIS